jgi:hypothetical protein
MSVAAATQPPAASARPAGPGRNHSFIAKVAAAISLIAVGDLFFFRGWDAGAVTGVYALLLLSVVLLVRPRKLRGRALAAAAAAAVFALALFDDPSLLALILFWASVTLAALLPRGRFDDAWRWTIRLLCAVVLAVLQPLRDWAQVRRVCERGGRVPLTGRLPVLILPAVGSLIFILLFAQANPLIGDALSRFDAATLFGGFSIGRPLLWVALGLLVWSLLRPAALTALPAPMPGEALALPGVNLASVTLSLLAFNAIFAVQNGLDLAFLWSGAPLPDSLTLAEYAHRGAYPLIATALLAALFVLLTLRPGSAMAASATVRGFVYLWIAQNVLLVASTMLRTLDYVEAYSLTRLRISALAWMALVAVGLLLICYRLWRKRSDAWLINANFAAAALVLTGCAVIDLGAAAATWNVRHTRDVGGPGAALDLCYLNQMGASSLLPLVVLESGRLGPVVRSRVQWSRNLQMDRLEAQQADWRRWTFRGARRLAEAQRLIAERRLPRSTAEARGCNAIPLAPALTAPRGE